MRIVVDSNIILDCLKERIPFEMVASKLLLFGYVNEAELWVSGAQINDLMYMLADGGKSTLADSAKHSLRYLRECTHIYRIGAEELDAVLNSTWRDLEDAYLYQAAVNLKADFIVTRDKKGFAQSSIRVVDASEFFDFMREEKNLAYEEIDWALAN